MLSPGCGFLCSIRWLWRVLFMVCAVCGVFDGMVAACIAAAGVYVRGVCFSCVWCGYVVCECPAPENSHPTTTTLCHQPHTAFPHPLLFPTPQSTSLTPHPHPPVFHPPPHPPPPSSTKHSTLTLAPPSLPRPPPWLPSRVFSPILKKREWERLPLRGSGTDFGGEWEGEARRAAEITMPDVRLLNRLVHYLATSSKALEFKADQLLKVASKVSWR